YDEATGEVLRTWPEYGNLVVPFVSSVDMGWLGAATWAVRNALPGARRKANRLWDDYRWDVFFDPDFARKPGANYGGFYTENPSAIRKPEEILKRPPLNGVRGRDLYYTKLHHYDTCVSEARMVIYLGIMKRQIPGGAYYATYRTFPPDWLWQELIPTGVPRTYLGVEVYNGSYSYGGQQVVPGWGGSMFEELMPNIFVPEERWAPRSWGHNHPAHVRAQQYHGLVDADYGYWGFSPSSNPAGGYREYGVDALGLKPDGYFSDNLVPPTKGTDYLRDNPPTDYGDGVVTPHASFLALMHTPGAAIRNLRRLERNFEAYGRGGFYDAIAVRSGQVAKRYLSLDQAMVLGALGNVTGGDVLQRAFAVGDALRIRRVVAPEIFVS
ncbi:MAG TPA: glucoamylase family protein, partial [Micropruina sp.]|nr:glucoamylase family protein [Micropruina sp.]